MGRRIHASSTAFAILKLLGKGAFVLSMLALPNLGVALKPFLRTKKQRVPEWRLRNTLHRLHDRGYVRILQQGTKQKIMITKFGSIVINTATALSPITIDRKKRDKQWFLLLFDIPESKGLERRIFQKQLRLANYYPLQKSVFISPVPFPKDLYELIARLQIQENVLLLQSQSLGRSEKDVLAFYR